MALFQFELSKLFMRRLKILAYFTIIIGLLLFSAIPSAFSQEGAHAQEPKIAVILILDYIDITELKEISEANFFEKEFDGGILSARSGAPLKSQNYVSIFATLNAGDRVFISDISAAQAYTRGEYIEIFETKSEKYFQQLHGYVPTERVFLPGFQQIKNALKISNEVGFGKLGDELKNSGVKRFVVGNGDVSSIDLNRSFALIVADERGEIGDGNVSRETLIRSYSVPAGYEANYNYIFETVKQEIVNLEKSNESGLIIIYPGDLFRLEFYKDRISESRYNASKNKIILKHISLSKKLAALTNENVILGVISVCPTREKIGLGSNTGFIFLKGWRYSGGKLLYSKTTNLPGAVFINDIPMTIAKFFSLETSDFKGNVLSENSKDNDIEALSDMSEKFLSVDLLRAPLISIFVFLIILTIVLVVVFLIAPPSEFISKFSRFLVYLCSAIPLAYILFGYFLAQNLIAGLFLMTAFSIFAAVFMNKRKTSMTAQIGMVLLLLTFIIFLDAPFSFLQRYSILGYSFNTGARFYGIGNEAMGIFSAGTFLLLSLLGNEEWIRRRLRIFSATSKNIKVMIISLGVILILFSTFWMLFPLAGANVGGSIAVLVGSIFGYYHAIRRKLHLKVFLYVVLSVIILALLFGLIVQLFPSFHLSKFIMSIFSKKFDDAVGILYRKISLNLKLIKFTVWNRFLIAILIALPVLISNPNDVVRKFFKKDAWVESLLVATAFGAVAAFLFNDSGVVAAATMLIYPSLIFMAELIQLRINREW